MQVVGGGFTARSKTNPDNTVIQQAFNNPYHAKKGEPQTRGSSGGRKPPRHEGSVSRAGHDWLRLRVDDNEYASMSGLGDDGLVVGDDVVHVADGVARRLAVIDAGGGVHLPARINEQVRHRTHDQIVAHADISAKAILRHEVKPCLRRKIKIPFYEPNSIRHWFLLTYLKSPCDANS